MRTEFQSKNSGKNAREETQQQEGFKIQTKMLQVLSTLLLVCAITFGEFVPPNEVLNGRIIINGRTASDGEFPYQISIQEKFFYIDGTRHICGGTIIDEHHVLTAVHCLYGRGLHNHFIVAGTRDLSNPTDPNRVNLTIEAAYFHEDYVHFYYLNDIAILRVSPGFPLDSRFINPIAMREEELQEPAECTVTGWGTTEYPEDVYPDLLQALDVPYIDFEKCSELYSYYENAYFIPGMLCAGYLAGIRDSCSGDSGGPLVCKGQLTGVVSFGNECALPNFPGVYADVAYYKEWIQTTLARSYEEGGLRQRSFQ